MEIDSEHSAIIVVDMQHGFCHPDGSLYAPGSEAVIEPINAIVSPAREAGLSIVFTRDVHPPDQFDDNHYYDEFARWGEHVVDGTWDAALHQDLDVQTDDQIVEKHTYDAFYRTELGGWLDARNVNDLVIVGTLANVCVLHTAGSAGLRDFRPILVEDAIGALEPTHKEYAIEHADWLFGEVTQREELTFAP